MSRYIGDLTDPQNGPAREAVARRLEQLAQRVRDSNVSTLTVDIMRHIGEDHWYVSVEATTRGRHET